MQLLPSNPGSISAIIQDETGYHILYVVERDPARLLSPDALIDPPGTRCASLADPTDGMRVQFSLRHDV